MPVTLTTFPQAVTNLPIWTNGENALTAGQAAGNQLGIIASYNALLAEVKSLENYILDSPPANPTVFDDEFNESALSSQWTLSSIPTGCSMGLVSPTWLTMSAVPGSGTPLITATEAVTTAAGFMFQVRFRLSALLRNSSGASPFAFVGLLVGSKSIGAQIGFNQSSSSDWIPGVTIANGNNFGTTIYSLVSNSTNTDTRLRIGLIGSQLVIQMSFDSYNWVTIYNENFSGGSTSLNGNYPTSLQLGLQMAGASSSAIVSWDYVRKIA